MCGVRDELNGHIISLIRRRAVIDIHESVDNTRANMGDMLAGQGLSSCDTVAATPWQDVMAFGYNVSLKVLGSNSKVGDLTTLSVEEALVESTSVMLTCHQ